MGTENDLFGTADAAAYTGYTVLWIKKLVYKGDLAAERVGHDLIFRRAVLDEFLRRRGMDPANPGLDYNAAAAHVGISPSMFKWWRYHPDVTKRPEPTGKRGKHATWTKAALDAWKAQVLDQAPSAQKRQASQA